MSNVRFLFLLRQAPPVPGVPPPNQWICPVCAKTSHSLTSKIDPKRPGGRSPAHCAFVCDDSEADISQRILSSRRDRRNPGRMRAGPAQTNLIASTGSNLDARSAGYQPKNTPTNTDDVTASVTDQGSMINVQSAKRETTSDAAPPRMTPTTPPMIERPIASRRNCQTISFRLGPQQAELRSLGSSQ